MLNIDAMDKLVGSINRVPFTPTGDVPKQAGDIKQGKVSFMGSGQTSQPLSTGMMGYEGEEESGGAEGKPIALAQALQGTQGIGTQSYGTSSYPELSATGNRTQDLIKLGAYGLKTGSQLLDAFGQSGYARYAGVAGEAAGLGLTGYNMLTGQAHTGDYVNVANAAAKYGAGVNIAPYTGGAVSLYNITQGSQNPSDYMTAGAGALQAGADIAAIGAYAEGLAGAGGAATSAASSSAGMASAGLGAGASAVGSMGVGYAVPALLDTVGIIPSYKHQDARNLSIMASGTVGGFVAGGPIGAVFGNAGAGIYGFVSGKNEPDLTSIEQEKIREYTDKIQEYASQNPDFVYKQDEFLNYSDSELRTPYKTWFGDYNTLSTTDDPSQWLRDQYASGTAPAINSPEPKINSGEISYGDWSAQYNLSDEQINEMLKAGTFSQYVANYQELENARKQSMHNRMSVDINNMMHMGPSYTSTAFVGMPGGPTQYPVNAPGIPGPPPEYMAAYNAANAPVTTTPALASPYTIKPVSVGNFPDLSNIDLSGYMIQT